MCMLCCLTLGRAVQGAPGAGIIQFGSTTMVHEQTYTLLNMSLPTYYIHLYTTYMYVIICIYVYIYIYT